ncbi:MAG: epimerase, partial [Nitrospina sp.]|nr:epimerase [Nitrospina sp.]
RDRVIGQAINLGTGTDTSVVDIARKILKALNKPESLLQFIEDRPGQVTRHISSTQKSHDCLEWKAKIDLDEGLDRTIEFYRNNRQWWEQGMKELWLP